MGLVTGFAELEGAWRGPRESPRPFLIHCPPARRQQRDAVFHGQAPLTKRAPFRSWVLASESQTVSSHGSAWSKLACCLTLFGLFTALSAFGQEQGDPDDPRERAIHYRSPENLADPVTRLHGQLPPAQ